MTENDTRLDPSKLTLGEVARVEELANQPFTGLSDSDRPKGKVLAALAYVAMKRHDPAYTWNDALALTFDQLGDIVNLDGDDDETPADPTADDSGNE